MAALTALGAPWAYRVLKFRHRCADKERGHPLACRRARYSTRYAHLLPLAQFSRPVEGIAKAILERPDAILHDVTMPGIDGPTTFGRLQAEPATREIPVILLTAKAQGAELRHFEELGVAGVLTKPFDPMSLPERVAEVLAGAARGAELVGEAE